MDLDAMLDACTQSIGQKKTRKRSGRRHRRTFGRNICFFSVSVVIVDRCSLCVARNRRLFQIAQMWIDKSFYRFYYENCCEQTFVCYRRPIGRFTCICQWTLNVAIVNKSHMSPSTGEMGWSKFHTQTSKCVCSRHKIVSALRTYFVCVHNAQGLDSNAEGFSFSITCVRQRLRLPLTETWHTTHVQTCRKLQTEKTQRSTQHRPIFSGWWLLSLSPYHYCILLYH